MSSARLHTAVVASAVAAGLATTGMARADEVTIFVNFAGAGCNVCGAADYSFPGGELWNDGNTTFMDPVPAGATVVQMRASTQGICDGDATVLVGGTTLGTSSMVGTTCACDLCADGSVATSAVYDGGFPGYVAGGTNTLQLQAVGTSVFDGVNLTIVYLACGDGNVAGGEECDTTTESATCDADCTLVVCGDGRVNAAAGEDCDVTLENPSCDADCTRAECGDEHVNAFAGEGCDDGNTEDGDGCSAFCQLEAEPAGSGGAGGGDGDGGGPSGGGGGGDSGPSGPTATGAAANGAGPGGGDDEDDDGDDAEGDAVSDATGVGGAGVSAPDESGGESGCGCEVPATGSRLAGGAIALVALGAATLRRARRR